MNGILQNSIAIIIGVPVVSAAVLAVLPGYWLSARLNILSCLLTLLAALSLLFGVRPPPGEYILVDDLNIVFIVLNTFIGFSAATFSASYINHELAIGRLTPTYLRFYHAMYQVMMFGMNLALVSNNVGLMWVAVELATLSTVLMVGIYRTHAALEAAWKYFILGSVGIALALFGTILVYLAAQPVLGEGQAAMIWTNLLASAQIQVEEAVGELAAATDAVSAAHLMWQAAQEAPAQPGPRPTGPATAPPPGGGVGRSVTSAPDALFQSQPPGNGPIRSGNGPGVYSLPCHRNPSGDPVP
ncbi:MAG: proton-conducting transporter membrane subunit, partial [Paracoccaceae bacterium]